MILGHLRYCLDNSANFKINWIVCIVFWNDWNFVHFRQNVVDWLVRCQIIGNGGACNLCSLRCGSIQFCSDLLVCLDTCECFRCIGIYNNKILREFLIFSNVREMFGIFVGKSALITIPDWNNFQTNFHFCIVWKIQIISDSDLRRFWRDCDCIFLIH